MRVYCFFFAGSIYPHTSGNYALGDLLTALKWVQLNIAHFGGNPESVTLLGHGQGAGLVTAITAVPAADGLYHRVWASNGAGRYEACRCFFSNAKDFSRPLKRNLYIRYDFRRREPQDKFFSPL
jgi:carboxylesterase type B